MNFLRLISADTVSPSFMDGLLNVLFYIFLACGAAALIYSIYLGFSLAKAENEPKRHQAKKRIMNAISGLLIIVVLTTVLVSYTNVFGDDNIEDACASDGEVCLAPGNRTDKGHWNILGVIVVNNIFDIYDVDEKGDAIHPMRVQVNKKMDDYDIKKATELFKKLPDTLKKMSNGQITASVDIKIADSFKRDVYWLPEDREYFISEFALEGNDSGFQTGFDYYKNLINPYLKGKPENYYDQTMVFIRSESYEKIEDIDANYIMNNVTMGWEGVNIREKINGVSENFIRIYLRFPAKRQAWWNEILDHPIGVFEEELLVHEFLHTFERLAFENKKIPFSDMIHTPYKFGHGDEEVAYLLDRQEVYEFYTDFMNKNLFYNGARIGLSQECYFYRL